MQPLASQLLQRVGIDFGKEARSTKGFVVFPEDGSESIPLPYPGGSRGLVCQHDALVLRLREAASNEPNVDLILRRARLFDDGRVAFTHNGVDKSVTADRIVGADGRGSIVLRMLGLTAKRQVRSRMIGMKLNGAKLPMEDYGHVFCSGPGPIFMYRLRDDSVSAIVDIPYRYSTRQASDLLLNSYAPWLPADIRPLFRESARERSFKLAVNIIRPRISYGSSRFVVIGDAAGHYHPMTAVGLTLGFGDALALAENENFSDFLASRFREIRAPEMLAMGFYEVFADHRAESAALRNAVYGIWRKGGGFSDRSVRLLACEDTSETNLGFVGAIVVARAVAMTIPRSLSPRDWRRAGTIVYRLITRISWFIRAVRQLRKSRRRGEIQNKKLHDSLERVFLASTPPKHRPGQPPDQGHAGHP
jgi:2-polyprenyl-6-methoxyphenol hydroxylase-like FAD-dependent oxidoreductase